MNRRGLLVAALCACAWSGLACAETAVRVFAAASLTGALTDIAATWQAAGHPPAKLAFGGSAVLAKQVRAGAPVHVYASADPEWMDSLQREGRLVEGSRIDLLGNALVLIAPRGRGFEVSMNSGTSLANAFEGKLCTGEPGVVPAGTYAREALQSLKWWDGIASRLVGTEDVRTALVFVERGECAAGVVYATDAASSNRVVTIARFPPDSHRPIVYPFALVTGAPPEATQFLAYLRDAPEAAAAFRGHGFALLRERR
jgi:molybdate transport system substrate-binding protein